MILGYCYGCGSTFSSNFIWIGVWFIIGSTVELNNLQCDQFGQPSEILQFIIQSGIINFDDVQNNMEAMKRKELIENYLYNIWQGRNGKWYTYLPDDKKGRVQRVCNSQKGIEDVISKILAIRYQNPFGEFIFV